MRWLSLFAFFQIVFGTTLRGNDCWAYQQDKALCLQHSSVCQWCTLGGQYGQFCAPLGSKNCFSRSIKPWYHTPEEKEEAVRLGGAGRNETSAY